VARLKLAGRRPAPPSPIKAGEAQLLADELFGARSQLNAAGRALHDHVGPLLSAAGIRLDLLRAGHPETACALEPALLALAEAMERVRGLSRELNPVPALHLGLKKALSNVVEAQREIFAGEIRFTWTASLAQSQDMAPPHNVAWYIYEAVSAALTRAAADRSATRISVSVRGSGSLKVTIESNGKAGWPGAELTALARRVRPAGIVLDALTKRGTIVIHYAPRRPPRG
jgi:signal transduction histidine kinase